MSSLGTERLEQHRSIFRWHMFLAVMMVAVGMMMIMTGALAPFGIGTIVLGAAYAVGTAIMATVAMKYDMHRAPPLPEELDRFAHHRRADDEA